MPHIILKLATGRSEEQKRLVAQKLAQAVIETLGSSEQEVSVSVEDIAMAEWGVRVYRPDIEAKSETLYKRPGYNPPS